MFTVYVIQNENGKIYVGHTLNLIQRLQRHNQILRTKKKSYTYKNTGRWLVVYKEEFLNRKEAVIREKQLKSYQGRKFIRQII